MMNNELTYANTFGEMISPLLILIRNTGFFEAYVYIPLMTLLAVYLFIRIKKQVLANDTFRPRLHRGSKRTLLFGYFTLCFLFTNATAVALKTFIVQELDYETMPWYVPFVAPLHVYISSVALAHLYVIWRNTSTMLTRGLMGYVQVGLLGGYGVAVYRLISEPFQIHDPTTGMSGIFFFAWFAILNWDLVRRVVHGQRAANRVVETLRLSDMRA